MNLTGMLSVDELFKGRHFDREIIVLRVRWFLRYKAGVTQQQANPDVTMPFQGLRRRRSSGVTSLQGMTSGCHIQLPL